MLAISELGLCFYIRVYVKSMWELLSELECEFNVLCFDYVEGWLNGAVVRHFRKYFHVSGGGCSSDYPFVGH